MATPLSLAITPRKQQGVTRSVVFWGSGLADRPQPVSLQGEENKRQMAAVGRKQREFRLARLSPWAGTHHVHRAQSKVMRSELTRDSHLRGEGMPMGHGTRLKKAALDKAE